MRRLAAGLLLLALLGQSTDASAQPLPRVHRIGVLSPGSATESAAVQREPFERGLRDLGWAPGSSLIIEYRHAEGRAARLGELARELVRLNVAVIVARSSPGVAAAREATASIPIVMSISRPVRVGVLDNAALRRDAVASVGEAGRALGLEIQGFTVAGSEALTETFTAMSRARIGAILVRADPLLLEPNRSQIVALAARNRMPAIYPWRFYVDAGGLMSYAENLPAFHYRSASYVDRILKGARPADLPVEQPTRFEFVVNLKAARALDLTIPHGLLLRADEVIE